MMEYFANLKNILTNLELDALNKCINQPPLTCFRVNTLKTNPQTILNRYPKVIQNAYLKEAFFYDKNLYDLGKTIDHFLGAFYIQDSSAMMVAKLLDAKSGDKVIDLCAAPGGKASQAIINMLDIGLLVANDISSSRAQILSQNIERLGIKNSIVLNESITNIVNHFGGYFDKVILDAPCSGQGMFRKNEEVLNDFSLDKVKRCSQIQKQLILEAYKLLRNQGIMVYSTCTYSKEENEEVIQHLLANTNASTIMIEDIANADRGIDLPQAIRLYPSKFKGEGHFICLIKCNDEHQINLKKAKISKTNNLMPLAKDFILNNTEMKIDHEIINFDKHLYYLPFGNINIDNLKVLRYGLHLGSLQTNRFEPSHALATSVKFKNQYQLLENEVYKYLHGETINCDLANGFINLVYNGHLLGLGKVSNNVIKNYLPKGLRR